MLISFENLNYKQKGNIAELLYLSIIGILSPFAVGLQTWSQDKIPNSLGYVTVSILQLPVIILFYRLYLPHTVGKKRYLLFFALMPFYIALYGLSERLGIGAVMAMPFIFEAYRENISGARPWDFTQGYFNTNIGYTFLILLAGSSLYVIKLLFKNQHLLSSLEMEKLKIELNQLKSQVHPHFFFNTINNLYSLSVQNSPKTPLMINDLSGIMRYMLYDTSREKVPLRQEVDFIKSYISLENLRHTQTDIISFETQGNIDQVEIEPLLFLPLIENTFKHTVHQDISDKWVKLVLTVDDDELIFQASNPKLQEDRSFKRTQSGIGLVNVRKRLNLLYPDSHELLIYDENDTFTVNITIRLNV
ncbi:sensor histidine kinase [Pedobacter foliorum]|uniref:sensor histidine kinase n=1 Tax=Pedobacter foliorum TaxID=2739058 RepID=UPI001565D4C0|nr:histidine kinase [Pedobacter foliorum]NRF40231.1 histidine kinase [Pedobacter foliorum]